MSLPCVHIGYHKTGTTTLQRHVFPRHPDIFYVGKPFRSEPMKHLSHTLDAELRYMLERGRLARPATTTLLWDDLRAEATDNGRVLVFSKERLCKYTKVTASPNAMAAALRALLGEVKVLMVIRHPVRLLESQHVFKVTTKLGRPEFAAPEPEHFPIYRFAQVADAYVEAFGGHNVGMFLFEELANEPASFARAICRFIGVDEAAGAGLIRDRHEYARASYPFYLYGRIRAKALRGWQPRGRLSGRLVRALEAPMRRGPPARVRLPDDIVRQLEACVRDDTRVLAERYGLPVEQYGYPL